MKNPCPVCDLHRSQCAQDQYEIARNPLWLLRHHPEPSPLAGWLLLDSRRHLAGPQAFTVAEASSWGSLVQASCELVLALTGCDRVYTIAFGEGAHHLHLHLIPRRQSDPETCAWSVADLYRAVNNGLKPPADHGQIMELVHRARTLVADNFSALPEQDNI